MSWGPVRGGRRSPIGSYHASPSIIKAVKDEAAEKIAAMEKTVMEIDKKRKASEAEKEALSEKIFLLLPPKSVKNDYFEQKQAKYVFKCSDGDIQIPEYGIMQTEFYYQEGIIV